MQDILERKDIGPKEKLDLYNDALSKYLSKNQDHEMKIKHYLNKNKQHRKKFN